MAYDDSVYGHFIGLVVGSDPTDLDRNGNRLITKNGNEYTQFRMVLSKPSKDEEGKFFDVNIFNAGLRESVKREVARGTKVAVEGFASSRTVGDKTYNNVMANSVFLLQALEKSARQPVAAATKRDF